MKKEEGYYAVVDNDYDEESWLENFFGAILDAVCWTVVFLIKLWDKIFVSKKSRAKKQLAYLSSNAIRDGNLCYLGKIPLSVLMENEVKVRNQIKFLFWTNPLLISALISLKMREKEKKWLSDVLSEIINFSKQNTTIAATKVLSSELTIKNKVLIISYLAKELRVDKRPYFINFFRKTFIEMGDPIKSKIEEIIGEKL